jgi:hypothetical protein
VYTSLPQNSDSHISKDDIPRDEFKVWKWPAMSIFRLAIEEPDNIRNTSHSKNVISFFAA